ncbi:hypothetical protein OG875_13995 [Streptomyces sp. NBC_01498]|uniref:hypothetical protein n=1 Tax=Streptomyces sp. NBC_01498 TaxID=2975870 RepID=UPI002E7B641B|nr:hypothetical protein [Streptomyces sp. NBC_01498]WTL25613.1 hypothetical protein OG875_13995 [Streptomyces sp. NBC_01498]
MTSDYAPAVANDITDEIVKMTVGVVDGWYSETRIDWTDVLERVERYKLEDGRGIDFGPDWTSAAIKRLKSRVRAELRKG